MTKFENHSRKTILITGASSGLGMALAKQLITEDDYFLVLTSRSSSTFKFAEELISQGKNIWVRHLNIIDHQQIKDLIDEINIKLGGVSILINNAGITERSTVEDSNDSCRQRQLDVNYLAPFELIAQILPMMRKKRYGKIINISSAGGFMAMPTMSAYSASKFALEAASESLWYEMRPWGIHVTLVIPGFINSLGYLNTIDTVHSAEGSTNIKSPYYEHYKGMKSLIQKNMTNSLATNDSIAKKISIIIRQTNPPLRVYVTFEALFFYWIRKLFPPFLYHFFIYKLLPNISLWGKSGKNKKRQTHST